MSDDDNMLDFGDDMDLGMDSMGGMASMGESAGLLETYPKLGKAYSWVLGALDTFWEFAGVFQPVFKHSWVFFVIYMGIRSNKNLEWLDLVPVLRAPMMEEEDDE